MFNFLKRRKYTLKNRLYIEADYLNQTQFKVGTGLTYHIDHVAKSITIKPCDTECTNHVSAVTQSRTKKVVPTIDLKRSDIKAFLNQVDQLEVKIYDNQIVFSVITEAASVPGEISNATAIDNVIEFGKAQYAFKANIPEGAAVVGGESISFQSVFRGEDVKTPKQAKEKAITMLSLFSGCGTLDLAFLNQGYDIKFAIDMFDPKRLRRGHIETYAHNIGNHIMEGDVLKLTREDVPTVDFVCGGVPCVQFSKMNSKTAYRNKNSCTFDLLEQYMNIVEWSNAKTFLIENVVDFVTVKGGILLDRIKERLSDFHITHKVINSKDLGSAQSRPRVFILGQKGCVPQIELPKMSIVKTVRDAFKGVETAPQQDICLGLSAAYLKLAEYIPQGGNAKHIPQEVRPNRQFNNFMSRLAYDQQAPTITGLDCQAVLHPDSTPNRKLSIRECARLFSLPDSFIFKGSPTSMFNQIKNGVDYMVGSFFARLIKTQLAF